MSNDSKNPFNEKTVVQTRQSFADSESDSVFNASDDGAEDAPLASADSETGSGSGAGTGSASNEKTMVYAQSNLKETFDARTVVMTKPAPTLPQVAPASVSPAPSLGSIRAPEMPPPLETAPLETPKVLAVELPPALEQTNPDVRVQTGSFKMNVSPEGEAHAATPTPAPAPKKKLTQEERREARKALDRKTKTMVAAFATLCALVVLCVLVAFGGPKTNDATPVAAAKEEIAKPVPQKTEMASAGEAFGPGKKAVPVLTDYQSTTDVLGKFDRAAQKAQQHAF